MSDDAPAQTADTLWGPGNWVLCEPCPSNDGGRLIHAKDYHDNYEKPTGTLRRIPITHETPAPATPEDPAIPEDPYCGEPFREKNHTRPIPWLCERPHRHQGAHGIPRWDKWGPEPA